MRLLVLCVSPLRCHGTHWSHRGMCQSARRIWREKILRDKLIQAACSGLNGCIKESGRSKQRNVLQNKGKSVMKWVIVNDLSQLVCWKQYLETELRISEKCPVLHPVHKEKTKEIHQEIVHILLSHPCKSKKNKKCSQMLSKSP